MYIYDMYDMIKHSDAQKPDLELPPVPVSHACVEDKTCCRACWAIILQALDVHPSGLEAKPCLNHHLAPAGLSGKICPTI